MGFGGIGIWEMVFIFLIILLLFGAKRLPEIGSSLGKGIREFRGSVREIKGEIDAPTEGERPASERRTASAEAPAEREGSER